MKSLERFGVAGKDYPNMMRARGDTYTARDGSFPTTNLACDENPYKDELSTAENILDFGCGVGRNLPWIMKNTSAHYWGIDPNDAMRGYFWDVQEHEGNPVEEWKPRVTLVKSFDELPEDLRFDYVVSTFVLQHLGYRFDRPGRMNLTDIGLEILTRLKEGGIFWALEHDSEERWIERWLKETGIELDVYIRTYKGLEELTHRDHAAPRGANHLMIFKK